MDIARELEYLQDPNIMDNILIGMYEGTQADNGDPTAISYTVAELLYHSGEDDYCLGTSFHDRRISECTVLHSIEELINQEKLRVLVDHSSSHPIVCYFLTPKGLEEAKKLSSNR